MTCSADTRMVSVVLRVHGMPGDRSSEALGCHLPTFPYVAMQAVHRNISNDVVLSDIHHLSISRPYQVAQNKSAWQAQTCSTRT